MTATIANLNWRTLPLIVMAGAVILSQIMYCSENPAVRVRYKAEKLLHKAERSLDESRIKPDLTGPEKAQAVRDRFAEALAYCYFALDSVGAVSYPVEHGELERLTYRAATRLSQVEFSRKNYDSCIVTLNKLLNSISLSDIMRMSIYINLGEALQSTGSWEEAVAHYELALQTVHPPVDDSGRVIFRLFGLPAHMNRIVSFVGNAESKQSQFERAEDYYGNLFDNRKNSQLSVLAGVNLLRLYEEAQMWLAALGIADRLSSLDGKTGLSALIKKGDLYATGSKDIASALDVYDKCLPLAAEIDSSLIPSIYFKSALALIDNKNIDSARSLLKLVKANHERYYSENPKVQFSLARTFELQGNWGRAETEYNYLIERYRGSDEAMAAFLLAADYHDSTGQSKAREIWTERARQYYDRTAARSKGRPLELRALSYKAELLKRDEEWQAAAEVLLGIYDRAPESEPGRQALLRSQALYRNRLGEPARADSLLDRLKRSMTWLKDAEKDGSASN